jgi:hypothetical protein
MKPLTRVDLKNAGCGAPGCMADHSVLYLIASCHPHAAVDAYYTKSTGTITIRCARCKALVSEIAVAAGTVQ